MTDATIATIELAHPMYEGRFRLVLGRYPSGQRSVSVVNDAGEACGSLTFEIAGVTLDDDELIIDEYREPSALVRAALASGAFERTGRKTNKHWVNYEIWRLR